MKTFRRLQKASIVVGMVYGLWLGCNEAATDKDSISGLVIVALAVIVALSILVPTDKKDTEAV